MTNPRRRAIVLGASIAGLLAARALARHFQEILLIERAELPDGPVHRSTVPQGLHTHGLLAGGADAIERLLPGLIDELAAQGCLSGDNLRDFSWIFAGARLAVGDSGVRGIAVARPLLEHAIRTRVVALPGVRIRTGTRVTGLVVSGGRVTGVRMAVANGGEETVSAEVVVDAMGRTSTLPKFLEEVGYPAPRVEEVGLATNYVSRTYARTEAQAACGVGVLLVSSPAVPRGGIALAIDARTWIVSQHGLGSVRPPLDAEGYLAFARSLSGPQLARILETSEPVSDAATMKFASSRRLHYEELERLPDGLFVCGDALASFNPTFGQGMTVAALQLELLESMGRDSAEPGANRRFLQQASAIVDVAWNTAAGRAFTYEGVRGRPTAAMRISNAYVPRVIARALSDVSVATALLRTMHFMAPPSSLFAPAILAKVLAPFAKRLAVLAYGVVAYALGASALLGWMLAMFGVVQFTGGPLGQLATGPALVLDLTLLVAFALQHSVMARPAWKARWLHVVGPALERPTYVLTTGAVLLPALWLWQPMPTVIWSLQNPVAIGVAHAVAVSAWIYLYVASFAIDHFELFGLRQVWCFFVDRPIVPVRFRERWMYRFDRHPIMTGALFGMWMTPTMMLDHLTFALGFSLYIVVGVFFEERSMRAQWGAPYEDYCERVGTIVPRVRFRARSTEGAPCDLPSGAVVGPENPG